MSTKKSDIDTRVFSQMQKGKPLRTYKKEIMGKLHIVILNPFDLQSIEEVLLEGNPSNTNDKRQFIDLWTEEEIAFFEVKNETALTKGRLVIYNKEIPRTIEKTMDNLPEEELVELVNSPFIKLKNAVEQMTSEAALQRVLRVADQEDRPEKTMTFLRETLSKLQFGDLEEPVE